MPPAVQRKIEALFGADFSDVRIHVGPQAQQIGALAFTRGRDLYFAPGQYMPHHSHGQRLLGHELAHVVQQRSNRVRNPFGSGVAVVQDPWLEAEADRMGMRIAIQPVGVIQRNDLDDTSLYSEYILSITGRLTQSSGRTTTYYRKTGTDELKASIEHLRGSTYRYDFRKYFRYHTGSHHRLWISTSLLKVRGFSNVDVSSSSDLIVMFVFESDVLVPFRVKAHQESGVQSDTSVVAMHREGFGDEGNLSSDRDVAQVLANYKGYNLGFTAGHAATLNGLLNYIKVLHPDGSGWIENMDEIVALLS